MFNPQLARANRQRKDSSLRGKMRRSPRIYLRLSDLMNGQYTIRAFPPDAKKNPHGYLDYKEHRIPKGWVINGQDPQIVVAQCPRSSNWDPIPLNQAAILQAKQFGQEPPAPEYKERCLCCELFEAVEDLDLYDQMTDQEKGVVQMLDWSEAWSSNYLLPVLINIQVASKEEKVRSDGSTYTETKYGPSHGDKPVVAILQLPQLYRVAKTIFGGSNDDGTEIPGFIEQCPDLNDPITGRNIHLYKKNEGKGIGAYELQLSPMPEAVDPAIFNYGAVPNFMEYGKANQRYNKPSKRLTYHEQLSLCDSAVWAAPFKRRGIPFTDQEADMLDAGIPIVSMEEPQPFIPMVPQQPQAYSAPIQFPMQASYAPQPFTGYHTPFGTTPDGNVPF